MNYEPTTQAVDPLAELDKKRKQQLTIMAVVGVILIVAAVFVGKALEKKNYDPGADGYTAIFNAGAKAGHSVGEASGQKAGQEAGQKQGEQEGLAKGTEQGKEAGKAEGTADGAAAALGNFGSWETGAPYVVSVTQGPSSDVPYVVESRTLMQPDTFYKICASGQGVCTEADNNATSGAGGQ
jgi:hypothetical protein